LVNSYIIFKGAWRRQPKEIPEPLDRMLGYTFAFRVRAQPKLNNSGVMEMYDDQQLMKLIMDRLRPNEKVFNILVFPMIDTIF